MFEKFTKKFSSKATEGAIESVKESFNDRLDQYGDIIKIGLVLSVIIFGGKHLTKKYTSHPINEIAPFQLPLGNGQPIVINNYYQHETKGVMEHYGKQRYNGTCKKGENSSKY